MARLFWYPDVFPETDLILRNDLHVRAMWFPFQLFPEYRLGLDTIRFISVGMFHIKSDLRIGGSDLHIVHATKVMRCTYIAELYELPPVFYADGSASYVSQSVRGVLNRLGYNHVVSDIAHLGVFPQNVMAKAVHSLCK